MCTIVILREVSTRWPMVIASNRDELFARPSSPPRVWDDGLVAPVDDSKGGTWMAMTRSGFFAAVTNQRSYQIPDPDLESRGQLVIELARCEDIEAARALVQGVDATRYNPFNLLYGDANELEVGYGRQDSPVVQTEPVPEGVHVLPNDVLDSPEIAKVARIQSMLTDAGSLTDEALLERLETVLRDRRRRPLEEVREEAAHLPDGSRFTPELLRELDAVAIETDLYGTRSSAITCLVPGAIAELRYADGPPQANRFDDLAHLIR